MVGFGVVMVGPVVWLFYWLFALARILGTRPREALVKAFWIYWAFLVMMTPVVLLDRLVHG